jgi:hypothetical protein
MRDGLDGGPHLGCFNTETGPTDDLQYLAGTSVNLQSRRTGPFVSRGLAAGARKVPKETDDKVILSVPASSVKRPFESPLDISMVIDALPRDTGVAPRRMDDVLRSVLGIDLE